MELENSIWLNVGINFLIIGSFFGVILSAILIFRPQWLLPLSALLNRRLATPSLSRNIKIDSWFYRYRYLSGGLILFGSLYLLVYFTALINRNQTIAGLAAHWGLPSALVDSLLDSGVLIVLLGAVLALFVSFFILLRPSLLREFEQRANRWISLRHATPSTENTRLNVDEFALRNAQHVGLALLLGSLYTWVLLIFFRP